MHEDKMVYLLVDEVHVNVNFPRRTYLLKRETNIVTIGMGIPRDDVPWPQLSIKRGPDVIFLRDRDLDESLNEFLASLLIQNVDKSAASNIDIDISTIIKTMVPIVLS